MEITKILTSPLNTNTYLVVNGKRAFVVDPGGDANKIAEKAKEMGAVIEAILITHAHFDHIAGVSELLQEITQSNALNCDNCDNSVTKTPIIIMHRDEVSKISSFSNIGFSLGIKVKPFTPDILVVGGETLNVAGVSVEVISTPGHSAGCVCYIAEDKIFVGDTIFYLSYGRTDFPDGSEKQLKNSILNKIFNIKGDFELLCGHGKATNLEFERKNNPIRTDL